MASKNAHLPLPLSSLPHPIHPPFTPSGPPSTAPPPSAFSAHASRTLARNIVNNPSPAMKAFVMEPIDVWYSRNTMSDGPQAKLTAAALAQVKDLGDPGAGDIPQYPINGLAPPCHPECLDWILHWVQDHTLPGWRMSDLWMQPAPVWSDQIERFPDGGR
ncbi:hypothetical protein E4U60_000244 [Claviceps pazoutovae]|uniref:Uncharacterized protein n=1 Tax=Claviceps pazoutovae TaxID=1649127 RepID=A0A9P7MEE0_9HYPO|nr:hypothetical protein E4U60_000244 [Claviceps pazoutovae]